MDNLSNPQPEADLEEMKKEMSQLTSKMAQIKAYLMGENAKLEADLVDGRERNRELERKIAETKRKNDDLEAQLRARNTEVRDGKAKIGELDGKINALQSKNSDLENQMNEIQQELVEARGKICGLETEIQCEQKERSDEFTKINSKISQSDDRSTKIGADLKEIDSKVAEMSRKMEADLVDERQRNRELERKIAEMKRKNDDLETQLRTQNTEVREGKAKIGELDGKINALQSKNSGLETQMNRTMNFLNLYRDGWSYLAKTASWYKVSDQRISFDEAEAYCASQESHLVSIHSQEENDFVQKLARTVPWYNHFWIGLKRNSNKENAFEWTDGSLVDFTNWNVGHPNSDTHALLRSLEGKWMAYPPNSQAHFICKMSSQF